jgi:GntR family transcriptional regulator
VSIDRRAIAAAVGSVRLAQLHKARACWGGSLTRETTIQRFFNPFPKYLQVRDILLRRLQREFQPGDQFPTEQALCREFGVSRETVREALRGLENDGWLSRRPGQGTFVLRRPPARRDRRLTGMAEDFTNLKLDTEARVLEKGVVKAPVEIAETMKLAEGEEVYRIVRVRSFEGEPLAYYEGYFPVEIGRRIAKLNLRRTSLVHELGATLGIAFWEELQTIEATVADTALAQLLDASLGAPLLSLTRVFVTEEDNLRILFRSSYRADRYYYTVKLTADRKPPRPERVARPEPARARRGTKAATRPTAAPATRR